MIQNITEAIKILKSGGIILHKTDTVWGLACDAANQKAIEKLKEIKGKNQKKGLIILISNISQLIQYVVDVPEIAWDLVEFAEKPLTVIYGKGKNLAQGACDEDGSIAIRLVKDDICHQLIHQYQRAIISTSANITGMETPATFDQVTDDILDKVDFVLPLIGMDSKNQASTIVKLGVNGDFAFIRK